MADLLQVTDLEAAKKHDTFHSEVITGKAGGVAGGADIEFATNQVTGQVQKTMPEIVNNLDWTPVGLFVDGATFTKITDFAIDANGTQWIYTGAFPFTATAGTVPSEPLYQAVRVNSLQQLSGLTEPSDLDNVHTRTFANVAAMLAFNGFQEGQQVEWRGYYTPNDGGGNTGIVKTGAHTPDGGSIFSVDTNTYIEATAGDCLNLLQWGGKRDLSFDSTDRFNALVRYAVKDDKQDFWDTINTGLYSRQHAIKIPCGYYSFLGTALLPSNIDVDLDRSVLVGNLASTPIYSDANTMFVTAFINESGVLESNITQPIEVGRCVNTTIRNGTITNCYTGIKTKNFNENCKVQQLVFFDVAINIDSFRAFYSTYSHIYSRCGNPAIVQAVEPSFKFVSSVNAIDFYDVLTVGRKTGLLIDGAVGEGTRGMAIRKCGFEECDTGLQTLYALQPISLRDNYFEYCGTAGADLSNASAQYVEISSNWFGSCGIGVKALAALALDIAGTNAFISCSVDITFASDIESNGCVSIPPSALPRSNDTRPVIPNKYLLGKKVRVDYPVSIYNESTGQPDVLHRFTGGLIDLPFTGSAGYVPGGVPFCEVATAIPAQGAVDVYVATTINYSAWEMLVFRFEVTDNVGTHTIQGRITGLDVFLDGGASEYPVTILDQNGKIRLRVQSFSSGTGVVAVTGIVRHM